MMSRRRATWLVFALGVGAVAAVLSLVSAQTLRLEAQERKARAQTAHQEATRLALWRMDSLLTPMLAREAARPYFQYRSFVSAGRSYTDLWDEPAAGERMIPSPLLQGVEDTPDGAPIVLHFQVWPDGRVSSPQAPEAGFVTLASSLGVTPEQMGAARTKVAELERLFNASPGERVLADADTIASAEAIGGADDGQEGSGIADGEHEGGSEGGRDQEFEARRRAAKAAQTQAPTTVLDGYVGDYETPQASSAVLGRNQAEEDSGDTREASLQSLPESASMDDTGMGFTFEIEDMPRQRVSTGAFEGRWLEGSGTELAFTREVRAGEDVLTQGFLVDWIALAGRLESEVEDLLPGAGVRAARTALSGDALRLASAPVRLDSGPVIPLPSEGISAASATLVVSWLALAAAVTAIGLVLRAAIRLSERRGMFVSAVTHELRTPLTTFRLYAQMLADGMVTDDEVRTDYLRTLKLESMRLSGIVENVLEYARLTRRAATPEHALELSPEALLVRVRPALGRRAEQAGMDLIVSADLEDSTARGDLMCVDPQSVERVLMNLVENACKYAGPDGDDGDPRIHLDVSAGDGRAEFLVSDHGPGVAPKDRVNIFGEFRRGGAGASRGGLGLGLALSRGLARESGGDLSLVTRRGHGAEFLLALPLKGSPPISRRGGVW